MAEFQGSFVGLMMTMTTTMTQLDDDLINDLSTLLFCFGCSWSTVTCLRLFSLLGESRFSSRPFGLQQYFEHYHVSLDFLVQTRTFETQVT